MKTMKHFLAVVILLLTTQLSNGQVQFGITGGIGGATQTELGNLYNNNNILPAFSAGIMVRKPISETFALKANLLYDLKGRKFDEKISGETIEYTEKFNYLTLPVKAEYSISVNKNRMFVAAGPYAGLLLDSNQKFNGEEVSLNDDAEGFDFGLAFELGYSAKVFEKRELLFSIGYDMGLLETAAYDSDLRNKSLQFNLGFLF